ncbi:putative MFS family arabinose efflux permease [Lentzea atacamensis]|uniref:MFS family arabinose efflux permease n=1 Tax=Lentzea atacamensis TaxID=531938 RepID=A0ABX9EBC0_9PSEU|nr:putative MFS family arabinose efflux permease [Lentzea atacamensis]
MVTIRLLFMTEGFPRTQGSQHILARVKNVLPLCAAGFVTAFGAHGVASGLGFLQTNLLALGLLLAIYDGAEIVLKPVFGSLADRIGPRPVLLGGLVAFVVASAAFVLIDNIAVARFGQGVAAAAFSPAAGAMVARLTPAGAKGKAFGRYGAWKGVGYTAGPLLGGVLIHLGGFDLLFLTMAALAAAVGAWVLTVPALKPLPRHRQTLADLAKRLSHSDFLRPTAALAASTAALATAVGFLPVKAAQHGPIVTGAAVSLLAITAALVQPRLGRALDAGRVTTRPGIRAGVLTAAAGFVAAAVIPGLAGALVAALLIGAGSGAVTPLAFAALATATPEERLGQTMGSAEVGRELGDAGGPLLVGGLASLASLPAGLLGLAVVIALTAW